MNRLARDLAEQSGGKQESRRRYLLKFLHGEVPRPRREMLDNIEDALGVDRGTLTLPPRPLPVAQDLDEVLLRLEAVEVALRAQVEDRELWAAQLLAPLVQRVAALESANRPRRTGDE